MMILATGPAACTEFTAVAQSSDTTAAALIIRRVRRMKDLSAEPEDKEKFSALLMQEDNHFGMDLIT
jgi:hypothetical protein